MRKETDRIASSMTLLHGTQLSMYRWPHCNTTPVPTCPHLGVTPSMTVNPNITATLAVIVKCTVTPSIATSGNLIAMPALALALALVPALAL